MTTIIFSADHIDCKENDLMNDIAENFLTNSGLSFKKAVGHYTYDNGSSITEKTFIVDIPKNLELIIGIIFKMFSQESVLVIDSGNNADLVYSTGGKLSLGAWTEVKDIKNEKAYTLVNNKYYVAK